jgi:hypothetical protein
MVEILLVAILLILWFRFRPKRDWYVVEWRRCDNKQLASLAFSAPPVSFTKSTLRAHKLTIEGIHELRHESGGRIQIDQTVFESLDAALLNLEASKKLFPHMRPFAFQKLYLWRVVASSRQNAITLPPSEYWLKNGTVLITYPEHFFFGAEQGEEEDVEEGVAGDPTIQAP